MKRRYSVTEVTNSFRDYQTEYRYSTGIQDNKGAKSTVKNTQIRTGLLETLRKETHTK